MSKHFKNMLKNITKDLPLHFILVALKWDHLADLKMADSDFRTPAYIDLLLGAKIFTSILHDGWGTGPWATPSTFNTCLRWVLFGKIQDSNVVDVANLTLRQHVERVDGIETFLSRVPTQSVSKQAAKNDPSTFSGLLRLLHCYSESCQRPPIRSNYSLQMACLEVQSAGHHEECWWIFQPPVANQCIPEFWNHGHPALKLLSDPI